MHLLFTTIQLGVSEIQGAETALATCCFLRAHQDVRRDFTSLWTPSAAGVGAQGAGSPRSTMMHAAMGTTWQEMAFANLHQPLLLWQPATYIFMAAQCCSLACFIFHLRFARAFWKLEPNEKKLSKSSPSLLCQLAGHEWWNCWIRPGLTGEIFCFLCELIIFSFQPLTLLLSEEQHF